MDYTKGLPCPKCGRHTDFAGGTFGGQINSTNVRCSCGFTAWLIITDYDKYEYNVKATLKDKTEMLLRRYRDHSDKDLLELKIKAQMAYDMLPGLIRPYELWENIKDIETVLELRESL